MEFVDFWPIKGHNVILIYKCVGGLTYFVGGVGIARSLGVVVAYLYYYWFGHQILR